MTPPRQPLPTAGAAQSRRPRPFATSASSASPSWARTSSSTWRTTATRVAVFNRTVSKVDDFLAEEPGKKLVGTRAWRSCTKPSRSPGR